MILLDTNILLRIIEPAHPMHQTAVDALVVLTQAKETICIVPQTLYEFWVVATRPRADNGLGLPPAAAHAWFAACAKR
jgi:predicted nucleic acid-binding protein